MHKRDAILVMLLVTLAVCLSGCLAEAVGSGGNLEVIRAERITEVYEASRKAVGQLEYLIVDSRKDATSANVTARDSKDHKVTVNLKATPEGPTAISIHVGTWGDQTQSTVIWNKIKENLEQ